MTVRLLLVKSETGLLKRAYANGATDTQCFDHDGRGCEHFCDEENGESCDLFNDYFDGSKDNERLPVCLEAERLAAEKAKSP